MEARRSFADELKRRNVLRPAALYAGGVWALSQGISQLSPALGLPDDATRWFLIACAIGFPLWVAAAWFYAWTPEGIKRESEVLPSDAIFVHGTARRLDFAIIGVLALAVVLLAAGYFVRRHAASGSIVDATSASFDPPADSLVVLPFANLSGDPRQQYFSDGITEELTDALGQNPALRVIAWATAATLRDANLTPNAIGRHLNVANIMHGSILRAGDEVRITAELVDARSGMQVWAHHYDGSFADVFRMQDQVSAAIASALKVKFAKGDTADGGTYSEAAHELVLKGRALQKNQNVADVEQARKYFEQAIAIDPNYANAHAWLSRTLMALTSISDLPLDKALPQIRAEAEKALELDPHSADAWVALGSADASTNPPDLVRARAAFRKALAIDPSNVGAHLNYGAVLPLKEALAQEQEATVLDPTNQTAWNNVAALAADLSDWPQVTHAAQMLIKLDPSVVDSAFALAFAYRQSHQYDKMAGAFDLVKPTTDLDKAQASAGGLAYRALGDPGLRPRALAALKALARRQSSPDVAANLLQMYLVLGETTPALGLLESSCAAAPVGCSDLGVNPLYKPLRGNARFALLARKYGTADAQ